MPYATDQLVSLPAAEKNAKMSLIFAYTLQLLLSWPVQQIQVWRRDASLAFETFVNTFMPCCNPTQHCMT